MGENGSTNSYSSKSDFDEPFGSLSQLNIHPTENLTEIVATVFKVFFQA